MKEIEITRAILHALNQIPGCFAYENLSTGNVVNGRVIKRSGFQVKGSSDILCCYHGRFIALECKTPERRGNTSQAQEAFIAKIRKCGGLAKVVTSVEEAVRVISSLTPKPPIIPNPPISAKE